MLRCVLFPRVWRKKGGELLYAGPSKNIQLSSTGTVVHVRDLFHSWPVRRKQQTSASANYTASLTNKLKKIIETYAIANPSVSFSLVDLERLRMDTPAAGRALLLSIPRSSSMAASYGKVFGKQLAKVGK